MSGVQLVVFDLAGTTIQDQNDVARCLHRAAGDVGIPAELDLIARNIGTNKIHLYQYLIELSRGRAEKLEDLERGTLDTSTLELSMKAFRLYERYMIDHYRHHAAEMVATQPRLAGSSRRKSRELCNVSGQRTTRALPPPATFSTSARLAMLVSPGVVMARAPWAAPYSTALAASLCSRKP